MNVGRLSRQQPPSADDALETPAVLTLDTIVRQAAAATGTSMALVSLIYGTRQVFRAKVGISLLETPTASSFCAHALRGAGVFVVMDASSDPRFASNPLVTGKPFIRFYAGAPVVLDGVRVGALCVLDDQPRQSFSDLQQTYLVGLAEHAGAALKLAGETNRQA